jgi:L-rhamnose-H+ transport protein
MGVLFHWIGGLAAGSFYVPYRGVRRWPWEVYWIAGGVVSWIIAPVLFALVGSHDTFGVLAATPVGTLAACYGFGVLWGLGGLTFGLTMRYLGMSMGMAVALGFCAAFGTLLPPIVQGKFAHLVSTNSGLITLLGVATCLAGIALVGIAGRTKERESPGANQAIAEFNLKKGIGVAIFSGIMSSCFSYGLAAGEPIRQLSLKAGTAPLMQSLPVLVVVLLGGFTTNVAWSLGLVIRNRSARNFVTGPLLRNYTLCALAGLTWYLQFYFYSQGEVKMGRFNYTSWTLHMASIIIFSSIWGFALKEWSGASRKALGRLGLGLGILLGATVMIGLAGLAD